MNKRKQLFYKRETRMTVTAILFLLPSLIGFIIFVFVPAISAFLLSLTAWDGFGVPKFIGFENYRYLLEDETFLISFKNNIVYTICYVPLTLLFALLIALGLNRELKGMSFFRCVFFLPHITAMVAVAMIWRILYNPSQGVFNSFLRVMGVVNPPGWISSSRWALYSVILMASWKSCGYYMIIFLAGLKNISRQLYEAASLDGATVFQQFRFITRPMLTPTIFMVSILSVISSFKVFDAINIMTDGGPGRATNVIVFNIYREGFKNSQFGYASSMAVVLFIIIMIITLIQFRSEKKWVSYL